MHVHGHSESRLNAHAAAPSAFEPALRALANLLVGLTTARDSSGGVWSNTFLAGAVPGAGPGLESSIPGTVPVPSVSAGASTSGRILLCRGPPLPVRPGWGGPSLELPRSKRSHERLPARRESRSGKAGARRRSPSSTRPSHAVPSPASASPAFLGAVKAGEVYSDDWQGFSNGCVPRPGPSGFSVRPHSSEMPGPSHSRLAGRSTPAPSGVGEDDRSVSVGSLDPEWDDSFASVLSFIREFHDIEEPAGVAPNRCKTSLAPVYGLQSESLPAHHLLTSPLLESLIEDINSALAKFVEDQTVHGFIPIPSRRHRRYYRTSFSSFPGPYLVPPGLALITLDRVSETKKRSVYLSHSQVSVLETQLLSVCEVTSWLNWWISTCGGFREHLSGEARANFERLMLSGSRALEFLGGQGVTALGNLVLLA